MVQCSFNNIIVLLRPVTDIDKMTDISKNKINSNRDADAILKMIAQSKAAYVSGKYKSAQNTFSDIRKNLGLVTPKSNHLY